MPVYEYECLSCSGRFELTRRITDEGLPECPRCGSSEVHKLISLSSFQLKGSGWYVTDYGGKKNGGDNGHHAHKKEGNGEQPPAGQNGGGKKDDADKGGEGKKDDAAPAAKPASAAATGQ